jgi:glycosyltransferase involved in cell wall biosynthesis
MIVPDPRHQELGQKTYKKQRIEENYFKLPQKLFSARELKQISFISSSQDSFGNFPLADELVAEILGKSRFMLLNSHLEGVPRVIAEALMLGTPCVVSSRLRSGLNGWLDDKNSIRLTDEPLIGAQQLVAGLENYDRFLVDRESVGAAFSEAKNLHRLKTYLSKLIQAKGQSVNGQWFLEDLHLRLACHGQKQHFQFFNNEKLFFEWIARASALQTAYADEDFLSGDGTIRDDPSVFQRAKQYTSTIVRRLVKP